MTRKYLAPGENAYTVMNKEENENSVVPPPEPVITPMPTNIPEPTNTPEPAATVNPVPETPVPVTPAPVPEPTLEPENTPVPVKEVKVSTGDKEIVIGESVAQLKEDFGEPSRIDETMYIYDYYIYNSDYTKFVMAAVADGKVVGVYTDALGFSYDTLNTGSGIEDVNKLFNKSYTIDKERSFTSDGYSYKIFFDTLDTQKITGMQVVKSDAAKRTGNPYDETILKNISLEIFDLTNSIRARNGVALLEWCDIAAGTAKAHSQDMADKDYFDHTNLEGLDPFQRMKNAGIVYGYAGENISAGRETSISAANGWFNSKGHRSNMLDSNFTRLGTGYAYNSNSTYGYYGTQNFYTPI